MSARLFAALTGAATLVSWFFREAATHWFFEKVVHVANDNAEISFEYGVPAAFAGATFYLLMRSFGSAGTGNPFERKIVPRFPHQHLWLSRLLRQLQSCLWMAKSKRLN